MLIQPLIQLNESAWCIASEIVAIQAEPNAERAGEKPFVRVITRSPIPRAGGFGFGLEAPRLEERVFVLRCESIEAANTLAAEIATKTGWTATATTV